MSCQRPQGPTLTKRRLGPCTLTAARPGTAYFQREKRERERERGREREKERKNEREKSVCVCVRERERECVCVRERERERGARTFSLGIRASLLVRATPLGAVDPGHTALGLRLSLPELVRLQTRKGERGQRFDSCTRHAGGDGLHGSRVLSHLSPGPVRTTV